MGVSAYVGMRVIAYAYPDEMPTWAQAVRVAFALVLIVCVIGFFVIRARMYWSGDDLEPAADKEPDRR